MIAKGNARAGGQNLAAHLLNDDHEIDPTLSRPPTVLGNEKVEIAELRGFVADDLHGALAEAEAIAAGTKCEKYLYSLSLNPSEVMTREQYAHAIDKAERMLGLEDQPRAVVYHVKNEREHCHVVWSRIDAETMKACALPFDRQTLRQFSQELAREFGHNLPEGLEKDRGIDRFSERFNEVSHAEKGQAERSGLDPADRRAIVTEVYQQSDNAAAFRAALEDKSLILARGDRRGFVVVDRAGDVHSLTRQIDGAGGREIRDTLKLDDLRDLPSVQEAKERHAEIARAQATERPQEGGNAVQKVEDAENHLKALTEAHRAEIAAVEGDLSDQLKALRQSEAERIDYARRAIKEAYREDWRDLYARQKEDVTAEKYRLATPARRLKELIAGRGGDAVDLENGNKFVGAFKFVLNGKADVARLKAQHSRERREFGDMQKAAERGEIREIKAEIAARRQTVREDHKRDMAEIRRSHSAQRSEAENNLDLARGNVDRSGDVVRNQTPAWGFGFASQGFNQQGIGFGRDTEKEREDGRELKPPGIDLNP